MGLKPIADRIIVRREAADDKTTGGIILPDTAKNKPQRGTIISVGPGKLKKDGTRSTMQLKAGDKVLFTSWAGDEFKDRKAKMEGGDPGDARVRCHVCDRVMAAFRATVSAMW